MPRDLQEQYDNLALAKLAMIATPDVALQKLELVTASSLRVAVRELRARCLLRMNRTDEARTIIVELATEWIGDEIPNTANQYLLRDQMLDLLALEANAPGFAELRAKVEARVEPEGVSADESSL